MATNYTNSDRILQAVLQDGALAEYGGFNPSDYETLEQALNSDNFVVCAVAKIMDAKSADKSDKEIYNEVNHYLQEKI